MDLLMVKYRYPTMESFLGLLDDHTVLPSHFIQIALQTFQKPILVLIQMNSFHKFIICNFQYSVRSVSSTTSRQISSTTKDELAGM